MKRKLLNVLLCFSMILCCVITTKAGAKEAFAAVDVGSNPSPKIDIAVNVPSDYPGTFLDFKKELTQKLVDQGMDPSTFRITSTAVSIDTTSMDGWYVYDHYHNRSHYESLVPADQRALQPYREASPSSMGGPAGANIQNYINKVTNKFTNGACIQFNRHIAIYQSDSGASNMAFAGYGAPAYTDYMIYPAPSSTTRTFSFNIDATVIDTHTLGAFGFFMNAGIDSNKNTVSGYLLYFDAGSAAGGNANVVIKKVNGINVNSDYPTFSGQSNVANSNKSFSLGPQKKVRLTVELKKDKITIQQQVFDAAGNLSDPVDVLRNFSIPQINEAEPLNGLGPWVGYTSHGCSGFSAIVYTDLEMSYEASAFDALKYVQYYAESEWKYFINLVGDSGNPNVPADTTADFADGIAQMTQDKIFYISNAQDGKIVRDTVKDPDGTLHQGLGSANGSIALQDDYVEEIAKYITKNYQEGIKFQPQPVVTEIPLSNFHVIKTDDQQQLMTIHLQHLLAQNATVDVNILDKSQVGTAAGDNGKIAHWNYKIYDPTGATVVDTGWIDNLNGIPNYRFSGNSVSGTYVFELTVQDQLGNQSKTYQTYLTAYLDNEKPFIESENCERNKAKIVLTDIGEGIEEDGITFVKDGRGSGVAAYWITNNVNNRPTEEDWEYLDTIQHQYSFYVDVESTEPIVVWTKDECDNIGNEAVFQPTHVRVEDPDGNPIDDYYVIDDKPIIVLPPDDVVPPSDDPDEYLSGWKTPDGKEDITPGTVPTPDENHEIIIRPHFSSDKAVLHYLGNGGTVPSGKEQFFVTGGSSILQKVQDQKVEPTRTGYTFTGWKYLKTHNPADASNPANLETITSQVATATDGNKGENFQESDHYYLVAQWQVSKYTLRFDANGGSLGSVRSYENVPYEQSLIAADISTDSGVQAIPKTGRGVPTRPGYIFLGWSTTKNNNGDTSNMFMPVSGGATDVKMGASDKTIYAVWRVDTNKYIVSFDSNGGSKVKDLAFVQSANSVYPEVGDPTRPGYDFQGWYLVGADGEMTTTTYPTTGTNITNKSNHTYRAKWTVRDDTKYQIEVHYNTGVKKADGTFVYKRVPNEVFETITKTGTTESKVSFATNTLPREIEIDGVTHWFNEENPNNVFEGEITGSPTLVLKAHYDRYFNVRGIQKGKGTVNSLENVAEGTSPTITWSPASGYHVSKVIIDGTVRDDLVDAGAITFDDINSNHTVYVEFINGSQPHKPNEDDTPRQYSIGTYIEGCTDGTCSITPTTRVTEGSDLTVTWNIDKKYKVTSIIVDGIEYNDIDVTKMDFNSINSDHNIVVVVEKLPSIGGGQTDGHYTVTVNRYGGDGNINVSPSKVVNKGDSYEVTWDMENEDYQVYKVVIDGKEAKIMSRPAADGSDSKIGYKNFPNMFGNHVVDIYYTKKAKPVEPIDPDNPPVNPPVDPVDPDNPGPKEPTFPADEYIKIDTQIVGGPGSITGGALVVKDTEYDVKWELPALKSVDDPDYAYYEVGKVTVNGKEIKTEEDKVALGKVAKDTSVIVELVPVLYNVDTFKYGDGTISVSKTLYKGQNYLTIEAKPNSGSLLVKVIVDGVEIPVEGADNLKVEVPNDETPTPDTQLNQEEQPAANNSVETNPVQPVDGTQPSSDETNSGSETTDKPVNSDSNVVPNTDENTTDDQNENDETTPVETLFRQIFGIARVSADDFSEVETNDPTMQGFSMDIHNIGSDHTVEAYFVKQATDPDGNPKVDPEDPTKPVIEEMPDPDKMFQVSASIKDIDNADIKVPGTITGQGKVKEGESASIAWSGIPANYKVVKVEVDGQKVEYTGNQLDLANIDSNKNVVVYVEKEVSNDKKVPVDKEFHNDPFEITTGIKGGTGTITANGSVMAGNNYKVTWEVTPKDGHDYKVKDVIIDGVSHPELVNRTSYEFKDIQSHHSIVVVIGDVFQTNIDIDGDGIPDLNIDTDKDGLPDVNIDLDGDGIPDVNIDTDNTGEWKPSSEGGNEDKIWKPDTNIDKGDGKPTGKDYSKPVDEDGNGVDDRWKPIKNIHPNGEENPSYDTLYTPKPSKPVSDYSPNTGDNTNTPLMVFGMLCSLAAYIVIKKRRDLDAQ